MSAVTPADVLERIGIKGTRFVCSNHAPVEGAYHWCQHIEQMIFRGEDAHLLHPTMTIEVPVFPTTDAYAQVTIGDPLKEGQPFALMWMEYAPDIGRLKRIPLGFWNDGEGAFSIRAVILDYLRSQLEESEEWKEGNIRTACPTKSQHSFEHQTKMQLLAQNDANWKFKCLWNIVLEGACTICVEETAGDPTNFGINPDSVKTGSRPDPTWTAPTGTPF